jgi:hypothetical protein
MSCSVGLIKSLKDGKFLVKHLIALKLRRKLANRAKENSLRDASTANQKDS